MLLVRAFGMAEMTMKIDVAIRIVENSDGTDRFVYGNFADSGNGRERAADPFQSFRVALSGRNADAQPAFCMMSDVRAMPHLGYDYAALA